MSKTETPKAKEIFISNEEYHAEKEHTSASKIKAYLKSPAHFKAYKPMEDRPAFLIGRAFETLLLEAGKFGEDFYISDDSKIVEEIGGKRPTGTKKYAEWKAKEKEIAGDRDILTMKEYDIISQMYANTIEKGFVKNLLSKGTVQSSIFFENCGVKLKTRPDFYRKDLGVCIDVKTAEKGSPEDFSRTIANLKYWVQAIIQIEGLEAIGVEVKHYFWLVVEKEEPHNSQLYSFNKEDITWARYQLAGICGGLAVCIANDFYPGYEAKANEGAHGVIDLRIPQWEVNQYSNND